METVKTDRTAFSEVYEPIREELARVRALLEQEFSGRPDGVSGPLGHISSYGGKQIRPALVLLAGKCCGELNEGHVYLGAVVELVHTATLVHDDILDRADRRRGLPTVHTAWGTETSVTLGDYLFSRAFQVLARFDGELCLPLLTRATNRMCEGELTQFRSRFDPAPTEAAYLAIAEQKTASLFGVSAQLGARLSGAPARQTERFCQFGLKLGLAFRIADDCLDIVGDEDLVGKTLGTDLGRGTSTLPIIRLMEQLSPSARQRLELAARTGRSGTLLAEFRELAQQHGVIASSLDTARELARRAQREIGSLPDSASCRSLHRLCERVASREH